jgi:hypothetical protein
MPIDQPVTHITGLNRLLSPHPCPPLALTLGMLILGEDGEVGEGASAAVAWGIAEEAAELGGAGGDGMEGGDAFDGGLESVSQHGLQAPAREGGG